MTCTQYLFPYVPNTEGEKLKPQRGPVICAPALLGPSNHSVQFHTLNFVRQFSTAITHLLNSQKQDPGVRSRSPKRFYRLSLLLPSLSAKLQGPLPFRSLFFHIMFSGGEPGVHSNQTVTPSTCQPSVKLAGGLEGCAASSLLLIRGRPQAPPRPLLPGVGSLGDGGYDASSRPHNAPLPPFPSPVCSSPPPSMPGLVLCAESDGDSHPPAARPAPRRTPAEGRSPAQAQGRPACVSTSDSSSAARARRRASGRALLPMAGGHRGEV